VLPLAIRPSTTGLMRAATWAAVNPMSLGRTTSPWLIGMPPTIWARYSPRPMRTRSSSSSPKLPAPTLVLDGTATISGGGKADAAGDVFAKYETKTKDLLAATPAATLRADAKLDGRHVALRAHASAADATLRLHAILVEGSLVFPGRNGILFHHRVARAALTPDAGVPLDQCSEAKPFTTRLDLDDVTLDLDACIARFETERPFRVRPTEIAGAELSVVLFLEDRTSGAIAQAATIPVVVAGSER